MYSSNNPTTYQNSPTPPVYGQPAPPLSQHVVSAFIVNHTSDGSWSTGLCDCCTDIPNCCLTFWCPCITFGRIVEIADKGSTSCVTSGALYAVISLLTGCGCIYSCCYRSKVRRQYMLRESPCTDCCVHFCCETCALCQEYRELKTRGLDPSLGWEGNVYRQNPGVAMGQMAPVMQSGMRR